MTTISAPASTTPALAGAAKSDTELTLIANEKKLLEAVRAHDAETLTSMMPLDSMGIDMSGILKMSDWMPQLNDMQVTTWEISNPQVQWVNDNTAIVMYTWTGTATWQGQPYPEKFYASTVWTEREGRWIAAFHQESIPMETTQKQ